MPVNVEIRVRPVSGNRLVDDYVRQDPGLAPFFFGAPFAADAYHRKAEEVRSRFTPEALEPLGQAVRPLNQEAEARLRAVQEGTGLVVTTGQQPGLFGGPIYTVTKALSAVALADRLQDILEVPVLPVFWVASDDHDWEEASHVQLLDTGNALHRLELEGHPDRPRSMGRQQLDKTAETALTELEQLLPPSEFTAVVLERMREAYGEAVEDGPGGGSPTVAGAFTEVLAGLLGDLPIALIDPQHPVVRRLGAPVIRRELERAESHERVLTEQTARLESAGYEAQVPILPNASNVFLEDNEHGRQRLLREDGGWVLRASGRRLEPDELERLLEEDPEAFSANVVLRPVLESAVLPTLAYVGGPGEVRYLAQTGCLFREHGVGMPLVYPRLAVTLVEGKVRKVLDKFGLDVDAVVDRPTHELVSDVVREDVPEAVTEAVGRLKGSLQEGYQAVFDAAREIDPTLKGPIFNARNDGFRAIGEVEKKIRQHVKMRQETELEQLEKAVANLAPGGKPQERVLNVHQYLARYGDDLIPAILEQMDVSLDADGAGWTGVDCGG